MGNQEECTSAEAAPSSSCTDVDVFTVSADDREKKNTCVKQKSGPVQKLEGGERNRKTNVISDCDDHLSAS